MRTQIGEQIQYHLPIGEELLHINPFIGKKIQLVFEGQINCQVCGKRTKSSFGQGSCYNCFANAPENSPCIINPELCEAHLGKGRDIEYEERNHNQPHIVYLAKSSAIKVGVTRETQVPTRWIDQGATEAIILAEVPYRRLAGEIEVQLKEHFTDKTNWRKMLKNEVSDLDLLEQKEECLEYYLDEAFHNFVSDNDDILHINYPVLEFPDKVKSLSFDKVPIIERTLKGIKGQYLYFENGEVLNIRKHTGYYITLSV
ncbi:MAG: DUF2797 domain-containing protein [Chitinophagales bacterium]